MDENTTPGRKYFNGVKANDWALGVTDNGTNYVGISFLVGEGEQQRPLTAYLYLSDAAADRSIEALRNMGFKGDDISVLASGAEGAPDALPLDVDLTVEDEEYEGKTYERVKWINKPRGGPMVKTRLTAETASSFAAALKARFRAYDAGEGKRVTSKPAGRPAQTALPVVTPLGDADIPF